MTKFVVACGCEAEPKRVGIQDFKDGPEAFRASYRVLRLTPFG